MRRMLLLALGLLLVASPALAAIAEVGSGSQRAQVFADLVDSVTIAFPANVTAGGLLVVGGAAYFSSGNGTFVVSDTQSTSYGVFSGPGADASTKEFLAYGLAPSSAACTVTINPDGASAYVSASIDEFSGVHATPLDVNGGESTGYDTAPADSLTTLTANDLVVAIATDNVVNASWTVGSGYTLIGSYNNTGGGHQSYALEFQVVGAAGSYTAGFALGVASHWAVYTAAFKPAAGGATPIRHRSNQSSLILPLPDIVAGRAQ